MQPNIGYTETADGVSIAFTTVGEGRPLVLMSSLPFSHVQLEWTIPEIRSWYQRLARDRTLIRYDSRGFGLSERAVDDFSLEAHVLDLESVIDQVGIAKARGGCGGQDIQPARRNHSRTERNLARIDEMNAHWVAPSLGGLA